MKICVYLGSSSGNAPVYAQTAHEFGKLLAENGDGLVYGGGHVGLMGIVADAVIANGGEAEGVITEYLVDKEVGHHNLTALHVVKSMHERKAMMMELADAFVALPGGWGTMEELFEVLTWQQLGLHTKPVAILNINEFYTPLIEQLHRFVEEGFVGAKHLDTLIIEDDSARLIARLHRAEIRYHSKWTKKTAFEL